MSNYDAGDNIIDLSQVNNIYLIKEEKKEIEEMKERKEKKEREEKDENKDDNEKLIHYIIYSAVGVAIIVMIITIILCVRKKKPRPMIRNLNVKQYIPNIFQPSLKTNKIHKQIKINEKLSKNHKKKLKKNFKSYNNSQK